MGWRRSTERYANLWLGSFQMPRGLPLLCLSAHWCCRCDIGARIRVLLLLQVTKSTFYQLKFRRYRLEAELAAMNWKIRWEELDGDGGEKKEKKKKKSRKIDPFGPPDQSEALLRSNSRISVTSDKVGYPRLCVGLLLVLDLIFASGQLRNRYWFSFK